MTKKNDAAPTSAEPEDHTAEVVTEPSDPPEPREKEDGDEAKVYPEAYVKELRDEAAAARVRAKRVDAAEDKLRAAAIATATAGILTDPTDLTWSAELADEDGWPDAEKITTAARELVEAKPHLGRPSGDVGQGQRGDDHDHVSLTDLLRSGT